VKRLDAPVVAGLRLLCSEGSLETGALIPRESARGSQGECGVQWTAEAGWRARKPVLEMKARSARETGIVPPYGVDEFCRRGGGTLWVAEKADWVGVADCVVEPVRAVYDGR